MDRSLEEDLSKCEWFLEKVRTSESYAQNVYAALCNMRWQPQDVWPVLKDEWWSCSWRYAGGAVAEFIGKGDYMDFYCSGIRGGMSYDPDDDNDYFEKNKFVSEGEVTDEIREDFARLGWISSPWPEDDK